MPGVQLSNFVTTTTRDKYFPAAVDNVYEESFLLKRLRGSARPWGGGARFTKTTTISNRTTGGSFSGFDTFVTTQEDVRAQFAVDPSEYYWNVSISGIQKSVNKGPEAFLDLIAEEMQDSSRNLAETMAEDLFLDGKFADAVKKLALIWGKLKSLIPYKHFSPLNLETI